MKKLSAGRKRPGFSHSRGDCWLFVWARFPEDLNSIPFDNDGLGKIIGCIASKISNDVPDQPEELSEKLLLERGDLVGMINNVNSTEEGYPVIALISDRFSEWIQTHKESGELTVEENVFVQKIIRIRMNQTLGLGDEE